MAAATGRLRRVNRLRTTAEFRKVTGSGRRAVGAAFVVVVAAGSRDRRRVGPRLGITVGRRVGKAVARNRLKRRIRHWFRSVREEVPPESDVVVIARRGAGNLSCGEVWSGLGRLLDEVGGLGS